MGKIVANFFISLDGVVESPDQWHFPYFDDEMGRIVSEGIGGSSALLLGRTGYDEWSQYWPAQGDDVPFAREMNGFAKYVVTHREVPEPLWANTTVLSGDDVAEQVRAVKDATDGVIGLSGSATLVRWLLAEGLCDELTLLVHPIVVGSGARLFDGVENLPLTLVHSETLLSGVAHLRYQPA